MSERIILVSEAASRLGVTPQTIRNWASNHVLKIKRIGKASYVSEDTVTSLTDTVKDVEDARKALEKIKAEYNKDSAYMWRAMHIENTDRRYMDFFTSHALERGIFAAMINLLVANGTLKEREGVALKDMLYGATIEDEAKKFGLGRERVRQIIEKAAMKGTEVADIEEKLNRMHILEEENRILKYKYENLLKEQDRVLLPKTANEKVIEILSRKIKDSGLSVRAVNVCHSRDILTIGDLCKSKPLDFTKMRNCGKMTIREIEMFLKGYGLTWGMDVDSFYIG